MPKEIQEKIACRFKINGWEIRQDWEELKCGDWQSVWTRGFFETRVVFWNHDDKSNLIILDGTTSTLRI